MTAIKGGVQGDGAGIEIVNDKEQMTGRQSKVAEVIRLKQKLQEERGMKVLRDLQGEFVSL